MSISFEAQMESEIPKSTYVKIEKIDRKLRHRLGAWTHEPNTKYFMNDHDFVDICRRGHGNTLLRKIATDDFFYTSTQERARYWYLKRNFRPLNRVQVAMFLSPGLKNFTRIQLLATRADEKYVAKSLYRFFNDMPEVTANDRYYKQNVYNVLKPFEGRWDAMNVFVTGYEAYRAFCDWKPKAPEGVV